MTDTTSSDEELLTVAAVAHRTKLTRYAVRTLIKDGKLVADLIGGTYYIPAASLRTYIASFTAAAAC